MAPRKLPPKSIDGKAKAGQKVAPKAAPKAASKTASRSQDTTWFKKGAEGVNEKIKMDKIAQLKKENSVWRFKLQPDEEAIMVFVDTEGFYCAVHNIEDSNGHYSVFITCTKPHKPCGTCDATNKKGTWTGHYTVIDMRTHIVQNGPNAGKELTKQKVLFPAKGAAINMIEDLKKKYGSLAGKAFKVKRYGKGQEAPNCGNSFEFIKDVKLTGENATPIDYLKVLAPLTDEEMDSMGMGTHVAGSAADVADVSEGGEEVVEENDGLDGLRKLC